MRIIIHDPIIHITYNLVYIIDLFYYVYKYIRIILYIIIHYIFYIYIF